MKRFTILSHTADIRLVVEASTLQELFAVSLEGLSYILAGDVKIKKEEVSIRKEVNICSNNLTNLLIDFLSEVLTCSYINKAVYKDMQITKLEDNSLTATISGVSAASFRTDIKAVTYHEANILKNRKGNYQTVIVLDI